MSDLFIEGPDVVRLLAAVSANDYEKFAVGQAKQFIPVTPEGKIINDAILFRLAEDKFNLVGISSAHNWVMYHGKRDNYNIAFQFDPTSAFRGGQPPVLFRYQVQGPKANDVIERAFGGPLPQMKFFHFKEVALARRTFFAFRHGMAAQAGGEFFGPWEHAEAVKEALFKAGEPSGMLHVGGKAYYTNSLESGWIPTPLPAIYTSPALADYRKFVGLFSFEGQLPIKGSFYSENIEDYYISPWELGYGRSISFNHEFIGREALAREQETFKRTRVTLVWDTNEVDRVFGTDHGYIRANVRDRVEIGSKMVGIEMLHAFLDPYGTVLSLALVDKAHTDPGTEVTVVLGNPPAHTGAAANYSYIKATVQPSPYTEYARSQYRAGPASAK
jgi:glycine cleavage system aminomethyltransferase T